ncbi:potassium channel family protein [Gorillibacterium massiliense]|uniref:potassium channel family protein n=1 Tax=Gorillibacterium massiliense TaxID=1280390 RepID=UPI0004B5F660|nr:TrkA family potassium uptake protein [Gorillibacterium massiliense]
MKKNSFVIIGLGRFGASLARELHSLGFDVLGIDKSEERISEMSEYLTHAVVADSIDEEALRSIGVRNFDCAVVAIGDDIQASIMTTILLKDMGIKKIVAKALTKLHGKVLEKIGVDRIVFPERDMGIRVAHQLSTPNLLDYIELSKEYTIAELSASAKINGYTLRQLDTRARFGCIVVAIINRKAGRVNIAPAAEDQVEESDVLVVIGTNQQIDRFESALNA